MPHANLALLGLLGLTQTAFLPGYLLLRLLRVAAGGVAAMVLSFGLSLLLNYVLVAALLCLGTYRPATVYAIFAAEVALWLRLDYGRLRSPLRGTLATVRARAWSYIRGLSRVCPFAARWLRRAAIGAAISVIGGFALAGLSETGRIFHQWDAVVSWNRWAVEMAANRLPQNTSLYPQLLPANISLSYVFLQTSEVWIFAKAVQFLFCLMLLLAMLDAARLTQSFGLVPGVAITYLLLLALLRYRMLASGYAEMPLAFFGWMPIYALLWAQRAGDSAQRGKWLLIGALLAAAAAVTKQMGLFAAATYPLLAWAWLGASKQRVRLLSLYALIASVAAPWYVYKCADMRYGRDFNNTPVLVGDAHEGRDLPARLAHAGALLVDAATVPGGAVLLAVMAASLADRRARWLLGLFVAPLGAVWAVAFSYDTRNLAMVIPFAGAAAGIGLVRCICWAEDITGRRSDAKTRRRIRSALAFPRFPASLNLRAATAPMAIAPGRGTRVWQLAACLALAAATAALCVPDAAVQSLQRRQQRRVGITALNERLYAHAAAHPDGSLIATDYQALRWLPELGPRGVACTCRDLAAFRQTFDRADVRYVLLRSEDAAAAVGAFLARPAAARLLFREHGYAFYEKLMPSG